MIDCFCCYEIVGGFALGFQPSVFLDINKDIERTLEKSSPVHTAWK